LTIKRGEVWLINFDPTIGAEIKKNRPAIVVNSDKIGILPIKLVAPITAWKAYLARNVWLVKINPNKSNGLTKVSAVDVLQLRGVDARRFVKKIGQVSPLSMKSITNAIALVIED
jgi:mRNA interferase MazF